MKPMCEIIVREVLPGLRAMICKELLTSYNLNQSQIAERLAISQPSVSQYLRDIRGNNNRILQNDIILSEIKNLCQAIYEKKISALELNEEFCKICKLITNKGLICNLHKNSYPIGNCNICLTS